MNVYQEIIYSFEKMKEKKMDDNKEYHTSEEEKK